VTTLNIPLEKIRAVIFDMDGLLLDTERIALSTFLAACRACEFEPDLEVYVKCIGTNRERTKEILIQGYGDVFPYDRVQAEWGRAYEKAISSQAVPRKAGARSLLELLKRKRFRIGLATSTQSATAISKLEKTGLFAYFDVLIGGDRVKQGKPHPETYLAVARRLAVAPEACLALEDSDNGVLSATRAGMAVIQIPDLRAPSQSIVELGHPILASLDDVEALFKLRK
jgi:HAD superfamily hydrolase (TIGR01509 family)